MGGKPRALNVMGNEFFLVPRVLKVGSLVEPCERKLRTPSSPLKQERVLGVRVLLVRKMH